VKIAHVTPYDLAIRGGVNASVVQLVRRQLAVGHDVDLIGGASADRDDVPSWTRIDVAVVRVPANGSIAPLAIPTDGGPGSELERLLSMKSYDAVVVHEPALPLGMALLDVSPSANVGVFHAYSETIGVFARGFSAFARSRTLGELSPWLRRLQRRIAVSTAAREFASSYLGGEYTIIPNGIDVLAGVGRAPERATVVFLGRPEPRKGLDVLLRAMPIVRRNVPSARLIVAGDGTAEQWARYETQAAELGLRAAVTFAGRVSEDEKRALFARATVYASPATGGESQGVVLLEAMALRTPVVASGIAGYRTVITDGVDGLLFEPNDPASLADALFRVLRDPALAARLADGGRRTVERRYDWRVVIPRHLHLYAAAIRAAHAPVRAA
jgi:phosphatidylinositol alpha-mannosyltransferase